MKRIFIFGAGQIGSRHLQALKKVRYPLDITVYDMSLESLARAKERYDTIPKNRYEKFVSYTTEFPKGKNYFDVAIIATCSDIRRYATEILLRSHAVRFLILEKLLFHSKSDYKAMQKILQKAKVKTYVNCSMRMVPHYVMIKNAIQKGPVFYYVSGRAYGLITNTIHYIDNMAHLCGTNTYTLDTSDLEKKPYQSKRKGFLEFDGTLKARFSDGSLGIFTSYSKGSAPIVIQIHSSNVRALILEAQETMFIAKKKHSWKWEKIHAPFPYQSTLTTRLVEDLFKNGKCLLPGFLESAKLHLTYLEALRKHLNKNSKKSYTYYPFT